MLEGLIQEGTIFESQQSSSEFGSNYISGQAYSDWVKKSLMYLQNTHPNHPQTESFKSKSSEDDIYAYRDMLAILKAFNSIPRPKDRIDAIAVLENIFKKFQRVSNQLRRRHDTRATLEIKDEYDVQDLLHSLLKLYFDDIRDEDWVPEYAGGKTRVDFLLKKEKIIIEVKKTRSTLKDKEIGNQLISDIAHYKAHPECEKIICFVYDPDIHIKNPNGLERDLNQLSEENGIETKTYIFPKD